MDARRIATAPAKSVRRAFDHEVEAVARDSTRHLSVAQLRFLALIGILATGVSVLTLFMYLSKYSTMEPEQFKVYHPYTAWFTLAASTLVALAIWMKGVTYWVAYVLPARAVIGGAIFLALYYGAMHPDDLSAFNFGPKWWRGT